MEALMLKLYRSGRFETLGDISPFIYKLETYLRMAGIPFDEEVLPIDKLMRAAPRNLIPYVDDDGEFIGDSSLIIEHLQEKIGDPLGDKKLSYEQQMLCKLIKTLCEFELFYIMIYGRWLDGDYLSLSAFFQGHFPEEQRRQRLELALESVKGMLVSHGIGRYKPEFVIDLLKDKLDCLSYYLGDGQYLFGDAPQAIDANLYAILASFIHFPLPNGHVGIARSYSNLVDYCDRIKAEFYDQKLWVHRA
jgi:glutathione S-transferase